MIDGLVRMRRGEVRPVYANVAAGLDPSTGEQGTLTLDEHVQVSLIGPGGVVLSTIPCTGQDTGALAAPRMWHEVDTSALAVGFYRLQFSAQALGSDGLPRTYEPVIGIKVEDAYVPPAAPSE